MNDITERLWTYAKSNVKQATIDSTDLGEQPRLAVDCSLLSAQLAVKPVFRQTKRARNFPKFSLRCYLNYLDSEPFEGAQQLINQLRTILKFDKKSIKFASLQHVQSIFNSRNQLARSALKQALTSQNFKKAKECEGSQVMYRRATLKLLLRNMNGFVNNQLEID